MAVLSLKIIELRKRSGPRSNHVSPVTYMFAHTPLMDGVVGYAVLTQEAQVS
jgi:hypothetical protein